MTDLELREKASAIQAQLRDTATSDEAIIFQIEEVPELAHAKLLSGANLFLAAMLWDRFPVAKTLCNMGADVHWTCKASMYRGNALNVAHSPQQADYLLDLGVEIERNLRLSEPFQNPAIVAADHNNTVMLLYWLEKQKEIFLNDTEYVKELFHASVHMVAMINQCNMLSCVIEDDELFNILKDVYSKVDDTSSIHLYLSTLRKIDDKNLALRKKELRKILNARKRELSSTV